MFILEHVKLIGEGEYNLNVLKEITATESYLELGVGDRGCQNEEPLHNCTTQHYIDTFLDQCECLPFYLRNEVISNLDFLIGSNSHFLGTFVSFPQTQMYSDNKSWSLRLPTTLFWLDSH